MSEMVESNRSDPRGPTTPGLSSPSQDQGGKQGPNQGRSARSGAKQPIENAEDCLAALGRLPILNMIGVINDRQTNAFKGVYSTMLQYYLRQQASPQSATLEQHRILDALRRDPSLANLIEPLLGQEQIDSLMAQARDESSESGPAER